MDVVIILVNVQRLERSRAACCRTNTTHIAGINALTSSALVTLTFVYREQFYGAMINHECMNIVFRFTDLGIVQKLQVLQKFNEITYRLGCARVISI